MASNVPLMAVVGMTFLIPIYFFFLTFYELKRFTFWAVKHVRRSYREVDEYNRLEAATKHTAKAVLQPQTQDSLVVIADSSQRAEGRRKKLATMKQLHKDARAERRRQPGDCSCYACCCRPRGWFTRAGRVLRWYRTFLPAPFDVSEALINILLRSQRDSLRVFLRARMVPQSQETGRSQSRGGCRNLCCPRKRPSVSVTESTQEVRYALSVFKAKCTSCAFVCVCVCVCAPRCGGSGESQFIPPAPLPSHPLSVLQMTALCTSTDLCRCRWTAQPPKAPCPRLVRESSWLHQTPSCFPQRCVTTCTLHYPGCSIERREMEIWTGIRFRTNSERNALLDSAPRPTETALAWFVRSSCKVSGLPLEFVTVSDFQRRFMEFIQANQRYSPSDAQVNELRVTADGMEQFGVKQSLKTVSVLKSSTHRLLGDEEPSLHVPALKDVQHLVRRCWVCDPVRCQQPCLINRSMSSPLRMT